MNIEDAVSNARKAAQESHNDRLAKKRAIELERSSRRVAKITKWIDEKLEGVLLKAAENSREVIRLDSGVHDLEDCSEYAMQLAIAIHNVTDLDAEAYQRSSCGYGDDHFRQMWQVNIYLLDNHSWEKSEGYHFAS